MGGSCGPRKARNPSPSYRYASPPWHALSARTGFVYLPLRPADVSHARISINATGKFDESQIDGAVKADLARLKSWNGCRVDAVRYDAKRSAALLAAEHDVTASGGSSSISTAIDEYGMDNVIYLSNDISCHAGSQNSSQDGWGSWYAWNPGSARADTDGSSSTRDIKKFNGIPCTMP